MPLDDFPDAESAISGVDWHSKVPSEHSSFTVKFKRAESFSCYAAFFVFGISICIAWNSILGIIPLFLAKDGASSQGVMIAAYNVPWLPLLLIQSRFDDSVDRKIGKRRAYAVRISTGMVALGIAAFLCSLDAFNGNLIVMGGLAFAVGTCASLLNTSFFQLMPLFPKNCYAFLPMGNGAATAILFGLTWWLGLFSETVNEEPTWRLMVYFGSVSAIQAFSLVVFFTLLASKMARKVMDKPRFFAASTATAEEVEGLVNSRRTSEELPRKEFLMRLIMPCISIFLNMSTTILPLTFYQFMPTSNDVPCLSQTLNYVYLAGDFLGRMLVLLIRGRVPSSNASVLATSVVRTLSLSVFLIYTFTDWIPPNDWGAIGFLGAYFTIGGLANTLIWTHGIASVPAVQATKASSVINIALEIGVFLAIPWSFLIPPVPA
eukprot:TRINITY_DN5761_c0_g1_i2.p1 TRINITY_DN5761_c0_g1~~TRINITY_DN5761_c0_g1_i2.p1  ORF type:complete len:459 (+),score=106.27 TRINITY_DN5761_c0_g1_i2:79-1377(+)